MLLSGLCRKARCSGSAAWGNPVQHYLVEFHGKSLVRERGKVTVRDRHEVEIKLGSSYPRTMPEIRWLSPIYHPNISEIGMVCPGGYGTHWVPSLNLDELCGMLWDMTRFHNDDIRSPYNRDAALWVANQTTFRFPLDHRPLRDLRAARDVSTPIRTRLAAARLRCLCPRSKPSPSRPQAAAAAHSNGTSGKAGRYHEFVRKFGESLHQIEAAAPKPGPARRPCRRRARRGDHPRHGGGPAAASFPSRAG